eukprot:scaffold410_cov267-Chaetoceros_neogracile.AAC.35
MRPVLCHAVRHRRILVIHLYLKVLASRIGSMIGSNGARNDMKVIQMIVFHQSMTSSTGKYVLVLLHDEHDG